MVRDLYQPELGRFMQPDPKEFAAGDYNLYRYCHNDPVNRSDPFGLWPTDIHNEIIDKALKDKLSDSDRQILKDASREVDRDQSTRGSFQHAMRAPGQSVGDARDAYQKFVANNLNQAIRQAKEGHRSDALKSLGRGMHAISDSASPSHAGFQVWNGLPNPITQGSVEMSIIGAAAALHVARESSISESQIKNTSLLINNYYQSFVDGTSH